MARSFLGIINPATTSGTALAAMLSNRDAAENSGHVGGGRPSYATEGMIYIDNSTGPLKLYMAVGTAGPDLDLTTLFGDLPGTIRVTAEARLAAGWLWCDGAAVSRVTYANLLNAICPTFNGSVATGSGTVTALSENLTLQGGFAGLIGAVIEGSGIPAGTTVTAIAATTLTLSTTATTGTFPNTPLRIFPHGAGNGTTTFTLPDFRGRAVVGRGDQGSTGNAGLITTAGGAGLDGTLLGRSGGVQGVTLTTTMIPGHTHPATATATLVSGATGNESADHTHSISFVSGVDNQNHTHAGDIWQGTSYANQAAPNSYGPQLGFNQSFGTVASGYSTGIQEQAHTHNIIGSTAGISVVHTHAIASLTLSATATVNANTGGDQLHSNTQPIRIENVVIKT